MVNSFNITRRSVIKRFGSLSPTIFRCLLNFEVSKDQQNSSRIIIIRMLDFVSTGQKSDNFVVFSREKNQKHSKFSLSNLTLFDIVNSHFETSNLSRHLKIVGDSDPNFLITDLLVMLNELTIFIHCHSEINRGLQSDTESNKNCFASNAYRKKIQLARARQQITRARQLIPEHARKSPEHAS